jgi:hypothetical protein
VTTHHAARYDRFRCCITQRKPALVGEHACAAIAVRILKLNGPRNDEEIEMGTGFISRFSLRTVRLILAGVLLATLLTVAGVNLADGTVVVAPPAAWAGEPGGSTGGG